MRRLAAVLHQPTGCGVVSPARRLRTAIWFVVLGALLVAFTLSWGALLETTRTYPPVVETGNAGFRWTALDPVTGDVVPRAQWITEALG